MTLAQKCLVVHMAIGTWQGARIDQSRSNETQNVHRRLIPKRNLSRITTALGALRTHFYTTTIPWKDDNGDRLLPGLLFVKFMRVHLKLKVDFDAEVATFIQNTYRPLWERMSRSTNEELLSDEAIASRFYVRLMFDQLAEHGDFAVEMGDPRLSSVMASRLSTTLEQRTQRAQRFIWERLEAALVRYIARMAPGQIFRDTTVSNLAEVIELAPFMNLLDDPELVSLVTLELPHLLEAAPRQLRKDPIVRAGAHAMAEVYLVQVRRKLLTL